MTWYSFDDQQVNAPWSALFVALAVSQELLNEVKHYTDHPKT